MNAALGNDSLGLLDTWLLPIRSERNKLVKTEGWADLSKEDQALKVVEANVKAGVNVLKWNADVIEAVEKRGLQIHGAVYDVTTGLVRELDTEEHEHDKHARVLSFRCHT